jgi:hypothetical protein
MIRKRRLPDPEQAVELLKKGVLDDRILHLSDEELREELAAYRRDVPKGNEAKDRAS